MRSPRVDLAHATHFPTQPAARGTPGWQDAGVSADIPAVPAVPPGLREAAERSTLVPFVGAGASRLAGCPGWSEFADGALQCFVDQGKFTYSQVDQIRHLGPRLKLSLAR